MMSLNADQVNTVLQPGGAAAIVHLVGAGGCGMSGLGHLLLDLGYKISGSDLVQTEEARQLQARGAQIHVGHAGHYVEAARPLLVIYSSAIRPDNPELLTAQALQIPIARRGAALAALTQRQRGLCVAGMHGKTTTAALLAYALEQLQLRPSYAIGAFVPQLPGPARFAAGSNTTLFVAEADESDGTLREFRPEQAILLNVDEEHLDHYVNFGAVCREFHRFANQVRGRLIYCVDDSHLAAMLEGQRNAVSYGFQPGAQYRVSAISPRHHSAEAVSDFGARFELRHCEERLGEFSLSLIGEKNISNAAGVVALLHQLGFAAAEIAKAIQPFRGAARRQQELYRDDRCRVFDDYGHHPCEVDATLKALRALAPRRLLVAFQPHRFTRTEHLLSQFAACFQEADRLWLTDIYAASEQPIPGLSGQTLAEAVRARGQSAEYVSSLGDLGAKVRAALEPGDLVLFLGAGNITEMAHAFAARLRAEAEPSGPCASPHRSQEPGRRRCEDSPYADVVKRLSPASTVRWDEPLAKRTTLRVGGRADLYVEPASESDLSSLLRFCGEQRWPVFFLGRGSNLLIRDGGIRGVVICLAHPEFSRLEVRGQELRCGAGARLKAVAVEAKRHGLSGLEFLEGIPGSVGGALRMNAGAMGRSFFETVRSVRFMDLAGHVQERAISELEVRYRSCPHFKHHVALSAVVRGQPAPKEVIEEKMRACSQKRWSSQPAAPSAGCIFKNPASIPAGKLIEELGLKGARVGGAVISDRHGNFIVNEGKATVRDILSLIEMVQARARAERGIELETEVEIVGESANT